MCSAPHYRGDRAVGPGAQPATLARQLLQQRSSMTALDAIEHLVGIQALAPYYALWCRLL
jgi:hypothetical protein